MHPQYATPSSNFPSPLGVEGGSIGAAADMMAPTTRGPADFQKILGGLVSKARMINLRSSKANRGFVISQLFPDLLAVVDQTLAVLGDLERATANAVADDGSTWLLAAGGTGSLEKLSELGDLCFLVSAELKAGRDHLNRLSEESGAFGIFSLFEQTEAKLVRGLCAVESDLSRFSGQPSTTRHIDLRRIPLQVRMLFGKFRQRIATAEAKRDNSELALRTVGASLAWLRGQDDFSQVRSSDRLTARELQQRIVVWLSSNQRCESEGRHIWDEITSFITITDQINQRQELLEHDSAAVTKLIELLDGMEAKAPFPKTLKALFFSILGRDPVLDGILIEETAEVSVLRAKLLQIQGELRNRSTGAPAGEETSMLA